MIFNAPSCAKKTLHMATVYEEHLIKVITEVHILDELLWIKVDKFEYYEVASKVYFVKS